MTSPLQLGALFGRQLHVDAASAPCLDVVLKLCKLVRFGAASLHECAQVFDAHKVNVARLLPDWRAAISIDKVDAPKAGIGLEIHQHTTVSDWRLREWLRCEVHAHGGIVGETKANTLHAL
jgi:hypothetical protein